MKREKQKRRDLTSPFLPLAAIGSPDRDANEALTRRQRGADSPSRREGEEEEESRLLFHFLNLSSPSSRLIVWKGRITFPEK